MVTYDHEIKDIQSVFFLFWSYLVCVPSFKLINSSSLSRKNYGGDNFTSNPLIGDYDVKIRRWKLNWYIELQAFCKLFYTYFYCFYLPRTKSFVLKTERYFTSFGQPVVARRVLWIVFILPSFQLRPEVFSRLAH